MIELGRTSLPLNCHVCGGGIWVGMMTYQRADGKSICGEECMEDVQDYDHAYFLGNPKTRAAEILWRVKARLREQFRMSFPRRGWQKGVDNATRTVEKLLAKNRQKQ